MREHPWRGWILRGLTRWREGRSAEVFPRLEACAILGLVLGALAAGGFAWLRGDGFTLAPAIASILGGIVGTFVGACWTADWARPLAGEAAPVRPEVPLWDAWLDRPGNPDPGEILVEPDDNGAGEPPQERLPARVRPRVLSSSGESIPLEDEFWRHVEAGRPGALRIVGAPGSGKSSALAYLAALRPPLVNVAFLDDARDWEVADAARRGLVVYTSDRDRIPCCLTSYRLAPWGDDERIEYLLANHRTRCASVMARIRESGDREFLQGIPELWRIVLDRMAGDDSIASPRQALRLELEQRLSDPERWSDITDRCLEHLTGDILKWAAEPGASFGGDEELTRLIRHGPVQLLLAAAAIAARLSTHGSHAFLAVRMPRALIHEAAGPIAAAPAALDDLQRVLAGKGRRWHAMAASLLHALRVGWRPDPGSLPQLAGALLDRADWCGVQLRGAELDNAELSHANLDDAILHKAKLHAACFTLARLRRASLSACTAHRANFSRADLTSCVASRAHFRCANFGGAILKEATLKHADLAGADLSAATLIRANLAYANLTCAKIRGTDFTGANLEAALLRGLVLGQARFDDARFGGADLTECNLEGITLAAPDFEDATLTKALLTSSRMPRASFLGADLREAGLAEVDWPDACLRDADLRGATFHLGTTRSGLVQSPIACEGSRTGFYTDEYNEQDYKAPEEIRKANLCGADLRGANITGVDFYLVDLRGARFDRDQAPRLVRSGAILESRCR